MRKAAAHRTQCKAGAMMKKDLSGLHIEMPEIATGGIIPPVVERFSKLQEEKIAAERKARLYFWGGIVTSVLCMIGGYLLGKYC